MSRDMCLQLSKNFISQDILFDFRKVTKYEIDTCTGSRVIENFRRGPKSPPPLAWNSVKVQITALTSTSFSFSGFEYVNSKTLKV